MNKTEFLDKVNTRPKKSQMLVRWYHNGQANQPQSLIYTWHDDARVSGIHPQNRMENVMGWDQLQHIKDCTYFKPDIMTKSLLTFSAKRPSSDEKYVGIEMEIISKLDQWTMTHEVAKAGLENYVNVKTDGSIQRTNAYPFTHELAVLVKEKELVRVISKLCKILRGNSNVNKSCGLHVHLDMRKRDADKAYANLFSSQGILYAMCPATRLQNTYCQPNNSYRKMAQAQQLERYMGINASAYQKYKTIEIRIHSGTTNAFKIINWVKLLIQIADRPIASIDTANIWRTYPEAKNILGLRGMLEKYVSSRIDEHSEDHENSALHFTTT